MGLSHSDLQEKVKSFEEIIHTAERGMSCPRLHCDQIVPFPASKTNCDSSTIDSTHLHCPQCGCTFCAICGEEIADAVSSNSESRSAHNTDWYVNPRRCPPFFSDINSVDPRWSEDPAACAERVQQLHTLQQLRKGVAAVGGEGSFRELRALSPAVDGCGFTTEELLRCDDSVSIARGPQTRRRSRSSTH